MKIPTPRTETEWKLFILNILTPALYSTKDLREFCEREVAYGDYEEQGHYALSQTIFIWALEACGV